MDQIYLNRRGIISRKSLVTEIAAISEKTNVRSHSGKLAALRAISRSLKEGRLTIKRRFVDGAGGLESARSHAFLTDQVLRTLYELATLHAYRATNPTESERLAIIAIGGYGRAEMAPHSDVDLLFVSPYKLTVWAEQIIEYILYSLWDLGCKVGQAVRSVDECIRLASRDVIICTSLLEARYICGDRNLFNELRKKFHEDVVTGTKKNFVRSKLAERDERHRKLGNSRYLVEPNIKDGKGGLRDLHTLFWLAKCLYNVENIEGLTDSNTLTKNEIRRFRRAERFFWTVRYWLHYLNNRAEERLTFDIQGEISKRLLYRNRGNTSHIERFMKHYFLTTKEVEDLTGIFCATIELEKKRGNAVNLSKSRDFFRRELGGFADNGDMLTITHESKISRSPIDMLRLFAVSQAYGKGIHPRTLTLLTRNSHSISKVRNDSEANGIFLNILTSRRNPELALRRMNESGILGRFIPDFGRVVAQTQHDMYHVYTVDEHSIRAVGILHQIESGYLVDDYPLATGVLRKIVSRRVLYLAVFLHDIAKGRGGNHSIIGEKIARELCPRFGLDKNETSAVAWLVRWHLLMSHTAFKRDLGDSKTITDFANIVGQKERLEMLLVLTVVDITAVGPNRWNSWKGQLLRTLYDATSAALLGTYDKSHKQRVIAAQDGLRSVLKDWTDHMFKEFSELAYESYWLSLDTYTQARQARFVSNCSLTTKGFALDIYIDNLNAASIVTVYAPDHAGLFSRLAGAFALSGANVVDAKANTTKNGMALDTFWVQNSERLPFDSEKDISRLRSNVWKAIADGDWLGKSLAVRSINSQDRSSIFSVTPRVLIDNEASNLHTVIEVNARDRIGLLYDLALVIASLELQISSSHITTYGERAVDVFYVKDLFGLKVTHQRKLKKLKDILKKVASKGEKKINSFPGNIAA